MKDDEEVESSITGTPDGFTRFASAYTSSSVLNFVEIKIEPEIDIDDHFNPEDYAENVDADFADQHERETLSLPSSSNNSIHRNRILCNEVDRLSAKSTTRNTEAVSRKYIGIIDEQSQIDGTVLVSTSAHDNLVSNKRSMKIPLSGSSKLTKEAMPRKGTAKNSIVLKKTELRTDKLLTRVVKISEVNSVPPNNARAQPNRSSSVGPVLSKKRIIGQNNDNSKSQKVRNTLTSNTAKLNEINEIGIQFPIIGLKNRYTDKDLEDSEDSNPSPKPCKLHTSYRKRSKTRRPNHSSDEPYTSEDEGKVNACQSKQRLKSTSSPDFKIKTKIIQSMSSSICILCAKTFRNPKLLNQHTKSVHTHSPAKCETCDDKVFKNSELLKLHRRRTHASQPDNHKSGFKEDRINEQGVRKSDHQNQNPHETSTCTLCTKTFRTVQKLKQHTKAVHTESAVSCEICDKEFKNDLLLKLHRRRTHSSKPDSKKTRLNEDRFDHAVPESSTCTLCTKTFKTIQQLKKHTKAVHTESPVYCEICGKVFKNDLLLKLHRRRTHPSRPDLPDCKKGGASKNRFGNLVIKSFVCILCTKPFGTVKQLKNHTKAVHTDSPVNCETCGKTCRNDELLKVHKRRNHSTKPGSMKATLIKDRIRKQIARKSNPENLNLDCKLCDVHFTYKEALQLHEESFHDVTKTIYCRWCNKEYKNLAVLKFHIRRIHSQRMNVNVSCEICQTNFKNKGTLKVHRKYMHNEHKIDENSAVSEIVPTVKSLLHSCFECNSEFRHPGSLRRHMRKHKTDDGTRHQCLLCPSNFRWKDSLSLHALRVHKNVESIICDECGKSFSIRSNFIQHSKTHVKDSVWNCQFCSQSFKTQQYQRFHERRVHGKAGVYYCNGSTGCDAIFQSPAALEKHTKFHHPEKIKNHTIIRRARAVPASVIPERSLFSLIDKTVFDLSNNAFDAPQTELSLYKDGTYNAEVLTPSNVKPIQPSGESNRISDISEPAELDKIDLFDENRVDAEDDWFENSELEALPEPVDMFVTCDIKPDINQIPHIVGKDAAKYFTKNDILKLTNTNLKPCPKLSMTTFVNLKRFVPVPNRNGSVFCNICCLNFLGGQRLSLHMERIHGIVDFTPKPKKSHIVQALARFRSKRSRRSSFREDKCARNNRTEKRLAAPGDFVEDSDSKSPAVELSGYTVENMLPTILEDGTNENSPTQFPCTICDQRFPSKRSLTAHKSLHDEIPQTCFLCKKVFKNERALAMHVRWSHSGRARICEICQKEFRSVTKVVCSSCERRVHQRAQKFTCSICKHIFKTNSSLRQHVQVMHEDCEDSGKRFMCDQCPFVGLNKPNLMKHMGNVHVAPDKKIQCELCGLSYKNKFALKAHKETHSQNFSHRCLFCSKRFNRTRGKRQHESHVHWQSEGYACKVCDEILQTSAHLEKHVSYKHSDETLEKLYYEPAKAIVLPESAAPWDWRSGAGDLNKSIQNGLNASVPSSTDLVQNPDFSDPHANFNAACFSYSLFPGYSSTSVSIQRPGFIQNSTTNQIGSGNKDTLVKNKGGRGHKSNLSIEEKKARTRNYHKKTRICKVCGILCKSMPLLHEHMAEQHPDASYYKCEECNIGFRSLELLQSHVVHLHNIPKPFVCPTCGEGFFRKNTYQSHVQSHNAPEHYCDICQKPVRSSVALTRHKLRVHHISQRSLKKMSIFQ